MSVEHEDGSRFGELVEQREVESTFEKVDFDEKDGEWPNYDKYVAEHECEIEGNDILVERTYTRDGNVYMLAFTESYVNGEIIETETDVWDIEETKNSSVDDSEYAVVGGRKLLGKVGEGEVSPHNFAMSHHMKNPTRTCSLALAKSQFMEDNQ